MVKEIPTTSDRPTLLLETTLGNTSSLEALLNLKDSKRVLGDTSKLLESFTASETVSFLKQVLTGLSRHDEIWTQHRKVAALSLLPIINFDKVAPEVILREYIASVSNQEETSDTLANVDALLDAGEILVPYFPANEESRTQVKQVWEATSKKIGDNFSSYIQASIDTITKVDLRHHKDNQNIRRLQIQRRRKYLLTQGFDEDFLALLEEKRPYLFDPVTVDRKLALLKDLGFSDPIKMVTTLPAIFALAEENIKGKLALLKDLGFSDPIKMVTTHPAIFRYAEENIKNRVRLFDRLIILYGLDANSVDIMQHESALFSSKLDKIWILIRIIREYQVQPQRINQSLISALIRII